MKEIAPVVGRLAYSLERKKGVSRYELETMIARLRRAADDLEKLLTCQ